MAQASGIISGYGDINTIKKDNVAIVRNFIVSNKVGTYGVDNKNFEISIDTTTKMLYIGTGAMYAYGYWGYLPKEIRFSIAYPNTIQYLFIYGEFDLSKIPNEFSVKMKNNGKSSRATWRQDALSTIKTGVCQVPLWRIKMTNTGVSEIEVMTKGLRYYSENLIDSDTILKSKVPSSGYASYEIDSINKTIIFSGTMSKGDLEILGDGEMYIPDTNNKIIVYSKRLLTYRKKTFQVVFGENNSENFMENVVESDYANTVIGNLEDGVTATTQSLVDSSAKVATTAFVQAQLTWSNRN